MLYQYLLFFFITVVTKFILAAVMIYLLLPTDSSCSRCDGETLLIEHGRLGKILSAPFFGRITRRWCPRCRWEGLARGRERRPLKILVLPHRKRRIFERRKV